jgi:hypothetical protein
MKSSYGHRPHDSDELLMRRIALGADQVPTSLDAPAGIRRVTQRGVDPSVQETVFVGGRSWQTVDGGRHDQKQGPQTPDHTDGRAGRGELQRGQAESPWFLHPDIHVVVLTDAQNQD